MTAVLAAVRAVGAAVGCAVLLALVIAAVFWTAYGPQGLWAVAELVAVFASVTAAYAGVDALWPRYRGGEEAGDVDEHVLNGRQLEDWELPALERARQRDRDRAAELLAGVLAAEPVPRYAGRSVDDLPVLP